jgi:hypothetical protein
MIIKLPQQDSPGVGGEIASLEIHDHGSFAMVRKVQLCGTLCHWVASKWYKQFVLVKQLLIPCHPPFFKLLMNNPG